jgi:uncharacterized RDD family membrane protein YckC
METNPTNPYEAPQSDITVPSTGAELATPWIRLGAAFVDGLILLPINWILQKLLLKMPTPADVMRAAQDAAANGKALDVKSLMPGTGGMILVSLLGIAIFLAVNFTFLKNGQTVGKKLLKLQVQRRSDSSILPVQEYLLKRIGPIYAVSFAAVIIHPLINLALLADSLCIFRPGRNTLHDDIAGTKVVRLPA